VAIKITIEREVLVTWKAKENLITKKTPTQHKDRYEDVMNVEEYAVAEVDKSTTRTEKLLAQEIADESQFDLKAVICAINKVGQ
jgi:hypothetical protein